MTMMAVSSLLILCVGVVVVADIVWCAGCGIDVVGCDKYDIDVGAGIGGVGNAGVVMSAPVVTVL